MNPYKKKINSLRTEYFLTKVLENLLLLSSIILILSVGSNFVINALENDYSILSIIVIIFKSLSLIAILFYIIRIILSFHSLEYIAKKIANIHPEQNEIILSSLEFENDKSKTFYSDEIINANIKLANEIADRIKFKDIFPYKKLLYSLKIFSFILCISIISFIINQESYDTFYTAITNIEGFAPKYDREIKVFPGDIVLLKGTNQKIQIENYYSELNYTLNYEQNLRWKSVDLNKNYYIFYNINDSIRYYIQNDFAKSDSFIINILEKPTIKRLTVYYSFPSYSKLSNKVEEDASGNIIALKGTKIKLTLVVNNNLLEHRIVFSDGQTKVLEKIDDFLYSTAFTVDKSLSYHFYLEDILNNKNQIIERTIYAEEDIPPRVEILFPAEDKILAQNLKEDIEFLATDDFGISELQIVFKKNNEEYSSRTIQKDMEQTSLKGTYTFDINDQNLLPGDVIFYYLIVYDNCTIPDRQSDKSKIYLLKFPSIEELYEEIQAQQEDKYKNLQETLNDAQKQKDKFDEIRRKFLKTEEMDWKEKEDLKSVLKNQKELAKKSAETAEEYKKFIDQIEKNKAVADETLEKLKQIQEIMEEIATPELNEALKRLQNAMQNINPEQMKKALNNFKFSQEEFLKKLEETLNLLKSIKLEQDMQKCLQQAEELEKLQKELNKKTGEKVEENKNLSDLAGEQEDISEKCDNLQNNLENLSKELTDNREKLAAQELQKALEQMEKDKLPENLENATQQMQNNNPMGLCSNQSSIQQSFSQLKQSIQMAQSMMQSAMQAQFQTLIEQALFELIYFSKQQEIILDKKYTSYDILDKEVGIYEGIKNSINHLYSMPLIMLVINPKFSAHTAETLSQLESIFEKISERRNYNVQKDKNEIYTSINKMIIDLLQSQSQMSQCKSGGGGMQQLMQQLQQMSQGQMAINFLTQALLEQMMQQSQGLTPQQRNMLDRIIGNEKQIKENLERLLRDFPEAEKLLGNLENIKEEIKEVIKKLEKGIIDKELIEKQQRILSRLLDAQKSIHRRDYSKRRESKSPEQQEYKIPDSLKIDTKTIQVKDILKFINENYPEEYHRLIKEYLERIQNE